ncbi:cytochrome P450 [Amycolatopsis acidiphila]|uniref:Cytochrome P450 n=1 Tax=Amycolatopsis acidiphila TaxID=715473 RepID=A0A558AFH6_9PSEU|nr:cytochrome P450 [Amycolatopsis acidiphila]TVT23012.1 cytochrome P450 [Amycolatopsis acidiphila]UIJ57182.1 cytochrome P450 [Amycolatopsis acidiphila]GHG52833.1 cytochrome P450 [Amycolatopsis acidiphila]
MTVELPAMPMERTRLLDPPLEYDQLREEQPVVRVRFPSGRVGWLVTRFDEGSQVFSDPRMSARRPRHDVPPEEGDDHDSDESGEGIDPTFVFMDEPDHGAYRRLLAGRFTPKSIQAKLQPYIDRIVTEHLDAIEKAGAAGEPVDLIEHLALPIPCLVICELLGVPYADRDKFHHATEVMMDVSKPRAERDSGARWLQSYITGLVADKRADPESTGLLADLIRTSEQDGSILTDKDLISIGVLLLFAGHDTTMAMIGLSSLTLLTHPEQRQNLVEHPEKIGPAVEELLRYLTIVQFGLGRTAKEDLEIGGQPIAKGDLVVVAMPAANRDPRAFDDPDVPDFDRKITRHLAFGYGVHQCLGQNVARAELKTILPRLFQRFPGLKLATPLEEVEMDTYGTNYGVRKMLVTW